MSNTSITLSRLDFNDQKSAIKRFLQTQPQYADYDFDGSNFSVLLDVLAYNSYLNAFYLNMVASEAFLDSSQQRDSAVSHAKHLNYTPRSFSSAVADVSLSITSADTSKRSLTIDKGTPFSTTIGSRSFTFVTDSNVVIDSFVLGGSSVTFSVPNLLIYEGIYLTDTFTEDYSADTPKVLSNRTVDTSSISVTVIEDNGASVLTYTKAESLFGLTADSKVFFVQGYSDNRYEIVFGDNVAGRRPKDNSIVVVEYRACTGQLPNGANTFVSDGSIDGESDVTVTVNAKASGGDVAESIEKIKYNAPRHFSTQERAVTADDYVTLLKQNFPEINAAIAYGGETLNPPQFGKVFVAVDITDVDSIPEQKKQQYYSWLLPRSPVAIDPVFVDADNMYLEITAQVYYDLNSTQLSADDIKTVVRASILDYSQSSLNDFAKTMRYSKLQRSIDDAHSSIVSNETTVRAVRELKARRGVNNIADVDFSFALQTLPSKFRGQSAVITSSPLIVNGSSVIIEDDGNGAVNLVSTEDRTNALVKNIGTVNYSTGLVQITELNPDSYSGSAIKFFAIPRDLDISTVNNVILSIRAEEISITASGIRA